MTAQIIKLRPIRQPTEAEAYVIRLAERADIAERAKLMEALAGASMLLRSVVELTRKDGRK